MGRKTLKPKRVYKQDTNIQQVMEELSRDEVFELYEQEVNSLAEEIAEEIEGRDRHSPLNGRDWCEENNVPESAFRDAVTGYLEGVDWGISAMFPFVSDDEVTVFHHESSLSAEEIQEVADVVSDDEEDEDESE